MLINKRKGSLAIFLLLTSINLLADLSGDPGEIYPVKINKNINSYLVIESKGIQYALIPLPFNKQGQSVKFNGQIININKKDFGESRITITNSSMVDLSEEDLLRASKESKVIKTSINTYSTKYKPKLNFIKPVQGIISSRYGKKRYINGSPRSPHLSLDIAAPTGTEIVAPEYGKVILTGDFFYAGKYIILDHGHGLLTSYSHLSKIDVTKGQFIKKGEKLGEVGASGRVTGPHLHWTVYLNKIRINPESLINDKFLESIL
tara:strand:+ start:1084 stop:1869 length:786 start_codon:yes stop_codon:yes gene_type:complete